MVVPTNPDQSKTERQPHTCPNKNKQEGAAAYKQRLFVSTHQWYLAI